MLSGDLYVEPCMHSDGVPLLPMGVTETTVQYLSGLARVNVHYHFCCFSLYAAQPHKIVNIFTPWPTCTVRDEIFGMVSFSWISESVFAKCSTLVHVLLYTLMKRTITSRLQINSHKHVDSVRIHENIFTRKYCRIQTVLLHKDKLW